MLFDLGHDIDTKVSYFQKYLLRETKLAYMGGQLDYFFSVIVGGRDSDVGAISSSERQPS